jgi:hypothetical protein
MRSKLHPRSADHDIAALAAGQGGVVSRVQLLALGLAPSAIDRRLAGGRLHGVPGHRGVFMVGHTARSPRTMLWAAHLAMWPCRTRAGWRVLRFPKREILSDPAYVAEAIRRALRR